MRWIVYGLLFANLGLFIWKIRDHQQAPVAITPSQAQGNQVNRLPLLSEMSSGALRARDPEAASEPQRNVDVASVDARDNPPTTLPRQCYSIGPLQNEATTALARNWLQEHQAVLAVREDERRETARYWVYFPPLGSREEAVRRVENLRTAGIADLIIIPRGDMSNAISLGVYTRKSSVDRRLAQLQSTGYQPSVVPRYRNVKATWVDVLVTRAENDMGSFTTVFPNLGVARRHCTTAQIAQAVKSPYNSQRSQRQYFFSGQGAVPETNATDGQPSPGLQDIQ